MHSSWNDKNRHAHGGKDPYVCVFSAKRCCPGLKSQMHTCSLPSIDHDQNFRVLLLPLVLCQKVVAFTLSAEPWQRSRWEIIRDYKSTSLRPSMSRAHEILPIQPASGDRKALPDSLPRHEQANNQSIVVPSSRRPAASASEAELC